jgi:hypothetical protein
MGGIAATSPVDISRRWTEVSAMETLFRSICAIAVWAALAACASSPTATDKNRPKVYRGGLYYGDAWHAETAKSQ